MNDRLDISQQFYNDLKRFIRTKVENPEDVNDILQDSLYKAQKNIHLLKDDTKVISWLYQITRNSIIDFYRKKRVDVDIDESQTEQDIVSLDINDNKYISNCIRILIKDLPEKYRDVLELSELGNMKQSELASHLSLSLSGTKSRIQRARKKLKDVLLECCHVNTDKYGNVIDHVCKEQGCS